jgi:hypothetical protein
MREAAWKSPRAYSICLGSNHRVRLQSDPSTNHRVRFQFRPQTPDLVRTPLRIACRFYVVGVHHESWCRVIWRREFRNPVDVEKLRQREPIGL